MRILKATLVPDESVPEFKRLRFEVTDSRHLERIADHATNISEVDAGRQGPATGEI